MAVLTWRNVNAETLPDVSAAYGSIGNAFAKGISGISDSLAKFADNRSEEANKLIKARMAQFTEPAKLQAAIASGSLFEGLDPAQLTAAAYDLPIDQLDKLANTQLNNAKYQNLMTQGKGLALQNEQSAFNLDLDKSYGALDRQAALDTARVNNELNRARITSAGYDDRLTEAQIKNAMATAAGTEIANAANKFANQQIIDKNRDDQVSANYSVDLENTKSLPAALELLKNYQGQVSPSAYNSLLQKTFARFPEAAAERIPVGATSSYTATHATPLTAEQLQALTPEELLKYKGSTDPTLAAFDVQKDRLHRANTIYGGNKYRNAVFGDDTRPLTAMTIKEIEHYGEKLGQITKPFIKDANGNSVGTSAFGYWQLLTKSTMQEALKRLASQRGVSVDKLREQTYDLAMQDALMNAAFDIKIDRAGGIDKLTPNNAYKVAANEWEGIKKKGSSLTGQAKADYEARVAAAVMSPNRLEALRPFIEEVETSGSVITTTRKPFTLSEPAKVSAETAVKNLANAASSLSVAKQLLNQYDSNPETERITALMRNVEINSVDDGANLIVKELNLSPENAAEVATNIKAVQAEIAKKYPNTHVSAKTASLAVLRNLPYNTNDTTFRIFKSIGDGKYEIDDRPFDKEQAVTDALTIQSGQAISKKALSDADKAKVAEADAAGNAVIAARENLANLSKLLQSGSASVEDITAAKDNLKAAVEAFNYKVAEVKRLSDNVEKSFGTPAAIALEKRNEAINAIKAQSEANKANPTRSIFSYLQEAGANLFGKPLPSNFTGSEANRYNELSLKQANNSPLTAAEKFELAALTSKLNQTKK